MKKIITAFLVLLAFFPSVVMAQEKTAADQTFKAVVEKIEKDQETVMPDGTTARQQDLVLKGLEGEFNNKIIEYHGIGEVDVIKKNIYQPGDKVLVVASMNDEGKYTYYVTDYVRSNSLLILSIVFIISLFSVGGLKGFRSLLSLALTFFVIMKYIVPQILSGADPIVVTVIGSFVVLLVIIYLTEGFNQKANIGVVSIFLSLLITIFLSWLFVNFAKLSGLASEESSFLIGLGTQVINFKGLLMAGIIIGTLGVLDDTVVAQIATINELNKANPMQRKMELFKNAYKVGVTHISSMTNTLFLAYAGASLPLLVLFSSGQSGFSNWGQAVNNEMLATEIVRTLAGSIGLILSVPITTGLAVWWLTRNRNY